MSEGERPAAASDRGGPDQRVLLGMMLAFLVPGAGHLLLGRRARALAFCLLVSASLAIGVGLQGNLYRVVPNQPLTVLATLGSMGMGVAYFVLRFSVGYQGSIVAPGYEYGTAFLLTAGLMNLLLVLDVWDIGRGRKT